MKVAAARTKPAGINWHYILNLKQAISYWRRLIANQFELSYSKLRIFRTNLFWLHGFLAIST